MCSIQEVSKSRTIVALKESEVTFGRGPFLGVRDKRVSRNHGTLKQFKHGVEIKSIHINPCFYARKSEPDKWIKLDKNETAVLELGDIFSLLPKQYVYEVINESHSDSKTVKSEPKAVVIPSPEKCESKSNENGENVTSGNCAKSAEISPCEEKITTYKKEHPTPKLKTNLNAENVDSENAKKLDGFSTEENLATPKKDAPTSSKVPVKRISSENSFMDGNQEVALPVEKKRKLPTWMGNRTKKSKNDDESPAKTPKNKGQKVPKTPKSSTAKRTPKMPSVKFDSSDSEDGNSTTTGSRERVGLDETVTPIRQRKENISDLDESSENVAMVDVSIAAQTKDQNDVNLDNTSTNVSPSKAFVDQSDISHPSGDIASTPGSQGSGDAPVPSSSVRSTCAYGSSCFRKNPQHFQEFSHPGDGDYVDPAGSGDDDDSNRPECPYGTGCYRKNPLHKKQYQHTKRVAPKRVAKMRAARKAKNDSSSDDYDYDDSFLNDDSDDDIDAGASEDEDSDWNPAQNSQTTGTSTSRHGRKRKQTNYAESESDVSTDDDDLDNLVSDAKKFTKNRKMWKK